RTFELLVVVLDSRNSQPSACCARTLVLASSHRKQVVRDSEQPCTSGFLPGAIASAARVCSRKDVGGQVSGSLDVTGSSVHIRQDCRRMPSVEDGECVGVTG